MGRQGNRMGSAKARGRSDPAVLVSFVPVEKRQDMQNQLGQTKDHAIDATVEIATRTFVVTRQRPFYFGRGDGPDVVGLEATDRGISCYAGSVEWDGRWWMVANVSRKCQLFLDEGLGGGLQLLDCLHTQVINVDRLTVWVPGQIRRHQVVITVPGPALPRVDLNLPSTGTITGVTLSDAERLVVVALFEGYFLSPPRYDPHPRTYAEAAARLSPPRTRNSVRKQVEHLKERLRKKNQLYFEGPRANSEMADYFRRNKVITCDDLRLLPPR